MPILCDCVKTRFEIGAWIRETLTMGQRSFGLKLTLGGVLIASAALASAQFNIDLNSEFVPPELGGGAPSSSFGAAANQAGFWNLIPAQGNPPLLLRGLSGELTSVSLTGPTGGGGGGNNFSGNTGDFALLLNDGRIVASTSSWTISGLTPGRYQVWTYVVFPGIEMIPADVTVPGSITSNPQRVSGPMPGNSFELGITYSLHEIDVNGDLVIRVDRITESPMVNGFQIVAVPEPGTTAVALVGLASLVARKRKR